MLTANQRDILAGLMTMYCLDQAKGLSMQEVIKIYELNREGIENYVVERCMSGREESLERMGEMPDRNIESL